jgi:hypothetical protein
MAEYRFGKGWFVVVSVLFLVAGCSSGGGDDTSDNGGGGTPLTITGSVSAPSGVLAKPQTAKSHSLFQWFAALFSAREGIAQSSGLAPVPSTNILVFRVDDAGAPSGDPLVTATTDGSGNFSLTLPDGVGLSGDLIAQASAGTTPQPVCTGSSCSGNNLNCPVVSTNLDLTPVAELATRAIFQDIAARAGALSDFTAAELAAFIGQLQTLAQNSSVGATVEATIDLLEAAFQPLIASTLGALAEAGEETPPDVVGTYNFVEFVGSLDGTGSISRGVGSGTLTLNADKTYQGDDTITDVRQSEACGGYTCDRTFTRNISSQDETFSGTYSVSGNGTLIFTDSEDDGFVTLGFSDPTGSVIIVKIGGDDEQGFVVALKQGGAASADGSFHVAGPHASIPETFDASGNWSRFTAALQTGTLNFSGSDFSLDATDFSAATQVTCTANPVTGGCSLSGTPVPQTVPADTSGTFTASSGDLTFTTSDGDVPGAVSPDGNVVWVRTDDGSDGSVGLLLGTRQGSGMSNASLNGAYNSVTFENHLGLNNLSEGASVGVVTFDGGGGFNVAGVSEDQDFNESCGPSCPTINLSSDEAGFSADGTYTVNADGSMTFTGNDDGYVFTFEGAVSPDGNVLTLHDVTDEADESGRFFLVGTKQ